MISKSFAWALLPALVVSAAVNPSGSAFDYDALSLRTVGAPNTLVWLLPVYASNPTNTTRNGASGSRKTVSRSPSGTTSPSTPKTPTSKSSTSSSRSHAAQTARLRSDVRNRSTPSSTTIRMMLPVLSRVFGHSSLIHSCTDLSPKHGRARTSTTASPMCLVTMILWTCLILARILGILVRSSR